MAVMFKTDLPQPSVSLRAGGARLHDTAYGYLKGLLLDGRLAPGDQISSEDVGQMLAMSRAPVSDAIRRLTVEGLLEVRPQIGCRVVTPVPGEVADFYKLFGATEGVLVRMAAERRTPEQATALRVLARSLADRSDLPTELGERVAALRERNRRRYQRLHDLAATPLSTGIAEAFWDRSDFYIQVAFGDQRFPSYVATGHANLVNAVIDADADAAERETSRTLTRLGRDVAKALEQSRRTTFAPRPAR